MPPAAAIPSGSLFEVHPDREVVEPVGGDDKGPDIIVGGYLVDYLAEALDVGQAHPVQWRIGIGDDGDATVELFVSQPVHP